MVITLELECEFSGCGKICIISDFSSELNSRVDNGMPLPFPKDLQTLLSLQSTVYIAIVMFM